MELKEKIEGLTNINVWGSLLYKVKRPIDNQLYSKVSEKVIDQISNLSSDLWDSLRDYLDGFRKG